MKIIGLTGSIGMGKSGAANMLRRLGIPVFDSDACARSLISSGGKAFETVALSFPEAWNKKTHTINRKVLGEIVFSDEQKKRILESILHPLIRAAQRAFLAASKRKGAKLVVLDIPLLFETGSERNCDYVICVNAPFLIQRERVLRRPDMTTSLFYSILESQMPNIEKTKRADKVVETGLGRAYTYKKLKEAILKLQKEAA